MRFPSRMLAEKSSENSVQDSFNLVPRSFSFAPSGLAEKQKLGRRARLLEREISTGCSFREFEKKIAVFFFSIMGAEFYPRQENARAGFA